MSLALIGRLAAAVDPAPTPSPTARVLEDWEVTPGLAGFLATFGVALAAVLLFLSLTRHMRKADAYARAHGIEVPRRKGIGFRREDATAGAPASEATAGSTLESPPEGPDGPPRSGPESGPESGPAGTRPSDAP
ncbi:hypothetical protein ACNHYB_14850 [Isoptericola jiangsuensis]|uniref:hypothetical protein n=1 Tax=Isoptericola jiangsuensis TaxID=548579 RepID=UPI003AB07882